MTAVRTTTEVDALANVAIWAFCFPASLSLYRLCSLQAQAAAQAALRARQALGRPIDECARVAGPELVVAVCARCSHALALDRGPPGAHVLVGAARVARLHLEGISLARCQPAGLFGQEFLDAFPVCARVSTGGRAIPEGLAVEAKAEEARARAMVVCLGATMLVVVADACCCY